MPGMNQFTLCRKPNKYSENPFYSLLNNTRPDINMGEEFLSNHVDNSISESLDFLSGTSFIKFPLSR